MRSIETHFLSYKPFFFWGGRLNRLGAFEEIHAPVSAAASPYFKVKNSLLLAYDEWAIPL